MCFLYVISVGCLCRYKLYYAIFESGTEVPMRIIFTSHKHHFSIMENTDNINTTHVSLANIKNKFLYNFLFASSCMNRMEKLCVPYAQNNSMLLCAKMKIFKVVCTLCATPIFHSSNKKPAAKRKEKENEDESNKQKENILLVKMFSIVVWTFSRLERLWSLRANQIDVVCIAHSHLMLKTSRLAQKKFFFFFQCAQCFRFRCSLFVFIFFFFFCLILISYCDSAYYSRTPSKKKKAFCSLSHNGKT